MNEHADRDRTEPPRETSQQPEQPVNSRDHTGTCRSCGSTAAEQHRDAEFQDVSSPRAVAPAGLLHHALAVISAEGIPFVRCSCGETPQSAIWIAEHYSGTSDDAVAEIKRVIESQAAPAGLPLHESADRDADNVPSEEPWREYAEAMCRVAHHDGWIPPSAIIASRDARYRVAACFQCQKSARACVAVEERRTAELRAEVERQAVLLRAINECHLDPARAILQADKVAGAAILRVEKAEATIARVEALAVQTIQVAQFASSDDRVAAAVKHAAEKILAVLHRPEPTEDGA